MRAKGFKGSRGEAAKGPRVQGFKGAARGLCAAAAGRGASPAALPSQCPGPSRGTPDSEVRSYCVGTGPSAPRPLRRSAFTIVELIVVMTVIVLILAVAVPGLSAMNAESRLTSARQTIHGVTTRAYYLSLADRSMTAVRIFPGKWDVIDDSEGQAPVGRQHLAIYSYVGTTAQETSPGSGLFEIVMGEYFERARDLESVRLPEDVWAAPLEALSNRPMTLRRNLDESNYQLISYGNVGRHFVLDGQIGRFEFDAGRNNGGGDNDGEFLNADDFMIVCNESSGVLTGVPQPFFLRAYAPPSHAGYETRGDGSGQMNQRYSFSGVVTYRREPFVSLGADAAGVDRQALLRERGRAYMAHRFSGGLLSGVQRPQ